ncbi:hypothetical protein K438DRAFT_882272 [Mycena galopus ATCC 62051]|nr:hypothetical protein K438DRAFT_882272 [Mycena galopus ATCC 62051]
MYSVRVHGSNSAMTAVLYQGARAEQQCRAEISQYSELRHPYLLQLYGIANTAGVHAAVFHEDLISYIAFRKQYTNSHFTEVFFWACITAHFSVGASLALLNLLTFLQDASQYIALLWGRLPYWSEYTPWIRLSTGSLTIELAPPEAYNAALEIHHNVFPPSSTSLLTPLPTFEIIDSISLVDYHYLCSWHLEYESSLEIAPPANLKVIDCGWLTEDPNIQDYWNWNLNSREWLDSCEFCLHRGGISPLPRLRSRLLPGLAGTSLPHFQLPRYRVKPRRLCLGERHTVLPAFIGPHRRFASQLSLPLSLGRV